MADALAPGDWNRLLELKSLAASLHSLPHHPAEAARRRQRFEQAFAAVSATAGGLADLYLGLIEAIAGGPFTLAQLGQSLDGRIAAVTGDSRHISSEDSLDHLHRLRALMDVVVVGATTVAVDNPRLTTRRVAGDSPTRAIIDPRCRLSAAADVFAPDAPRLVLIDAARAEKGHAAAGRGAAVIPLPASGGRLDPAEIVACLRGRGLRSILIEGGAHTISTFLSCGCLDRLHIAVAPLLIGSGTAALSLPPIARVSEALRVMMRPYFLGEDVLFECRL